MPSISTAIRSGASSGCRRYGTRPTRGHARSTGTGCVQFYGDYLDELFGYDRIYVLSGDDRPVYGFVDGRDERPEQLRASRAAFGRIWSPPCAIRSDAGRDTTSSPRPSRSATGKRWITGPSPTSATSAGRRRWSSCRRSCRIATPQRPSSRRRFCWSRSKISTRRFTEAARRRFRVPRPAVGQGPRGAGCFHRGREGAQRSERRARSPGARISRAGNSCARMALGLVIALLLLAALTAILMRWGRQQARKILSSEAEAKLAARTDALTGLPNRVALGEALPKMIAGSERSGLDGVRARDRHRSVQGDQRRLRPHRRRRRAARRCRPAANGARPRGPCRAPGRRRVHGARSRGQLREGRAHGTGARQHPRQPDLRDGRDPRRHQRVVWATRWRRRTATASTTSCAASGSRSTRPRRAAEALPRRLRRRWTWSCRAAGRSRPRCAVRSTTMPSASPTSRSWTPPARG